MSRVLRFTVWAANGLLIVLCAYWTAGLLLAMTRTALGGGGGELEPLAPVAATAAPTWQERRVVLDKNLFQVSTLLPDATEPDIPPDANLDETKLPLTLLGTLATTNGEEARASIRIDNRGEVASLRVGDEVVDGATLSRVERRRVVIDNRGNLEALSLDEEESARDSATSRRAPPARASTRRRTPPRGAARAASPARTAPAVDPATLRDPSQIIRQAQFSPRYEEESGRLQGIAVDRVLKGSLLEDMGMRDGDTIIEINGLDLEGTEDASELLQELQDLADIEEFEVQVVDGNGSRRTLEYSYE